MPGVVANGSTGGPVSFESPKVSPISDDLDRINDVKKGSEVTFVYFVDHYETGVLRLAQNLIRNREDAEEVLRNALTKAYWNLDRFRGDSCFYTWLVRIAVNEALMKLRQRRHSGVSIDETKGCDAGFLPLEIKDWGPNSEPQDSQTKLQEILAAAIRELEPSYRAVFQLPGEEEISTEETAEVPSLTSTAVKARLARARLQLRQSLNGCFGTSAGRARMRVSHQHMESVPVRRSSNVDR